VVQFRNKNTGNLKVKEAIFRRRMKQTFFIRETRREEVWKWAIFSGNCVWFLIYEKELIPNFSCFQILNG
jgi:hypothetical protein